MKKTQEKIGSCKNKHSVNVVASHLRDYFDQYCEDTSELEAMVQERIEDARLDGQAACEAVACQAANESGQE